MCCTTSWLKVPRQVVVIYMYMYMYTCFTYHYSEFLIILNSKHTFEKYCAAFGVSDDVTAAILVGRYMYTVIVHQCRS